MARSSLSVRLLLAGGLGVVSLLAGCSGDADAASRARAFGELERLVFVPAGRADLPNYGGDFEAASSLPLLVDRFEVRRRDVTPEVVLATGEAEVDLERPATFNWFEAEAFARGRGMRLPTAEEWIYVASGRLGHAYPWGQNQRRSVANTLELGLGETAPVGTFESGRGPFGTYDQLGNVWEWVADSAPGIGPNFRADLDEDNGLRSALGGSYLAHMRPLFPPAGAPPIFALTLGQEHRATDLGVRCVAGARSWLIAKLPELDPNNDAEAERLRAMGELWYRTGEGQLIDLLDALRSDLAGRDQRGASALEELAAGARR